MAFRKQSNGRPTIAAIRPVAAIPGGELQLRGSDLTRDSLPRIVIGDTPATVVVGSSSHVIVRVPEGVTEGRLVLTDGDRESAPHTFSLGVPVADSLHPIANPAVDRQGNIFSTLSGSRGQKTPVSVVRVDPAEGPKPFVSDIMNASGLAFDQEGFLYVSSRYDGIVYQITPDGAMTVYVEGMGVATGLAFDQDGNLYVGDRSGTIFKISTSRQIYVFATLEPSIAAYHLAVGPDRHLYVSGPTTSSFDTVQRVSPAGEVDVFYRGLGRPQGLAFDIEGNAYIAASLAGRRGVVRITPEREADLFLSGSGIVGLAFTPSHGMAVATGSGLYVADVDVQGLLPA